MISSSLQDGKDGLPGFEPIVIWGPGVKRLIGEEDPTDERTNWSRACTSKFIIYMTTVRRLPWLAATTGTYIEGLSLAIGSIKSIKALEEAEPQKC